MADFDWMGLGQTAAGLLGGYLQGESAQDAQQQTANMLQQAGQQAKFTPFGVSTAFGQSGFQYDPSGALTGAGYQLSPGAQGQLDTLFGASNGLLNQFTGSPGATAPMGTAAQQAMNLGAGYMATTPQEQAQKWMTDQQGLLAAPRAAQLARVKEGLNATGRTGFSMGGGVGGLQASNPEMQAYYNALAQQDQSLAAQATQGGMDYAKFGMGMTGSGGDMLKGMYGTQSAAFDPYRTAFGGASAIDALGQKPLDLSTAMGSQKATGAANMLSGMQSSAPYQTAAQSYNPWAGLLMGQSSWGK